MQFPRHAVHPHVRGVNVSHQLYQLDNRRFIPTCVGLMHSPRYCTPIVGRFIPTCVGLINFVPDANWICAVHPHVRGVNVVSSDSFMGSSGSSPRAWG